jgi:hypothetical protein
MSDINYLELCVDSVARAVRLGAEWCDVSAGTGRDISVTIEKTGIKTADAGQGEDLAIRVFVRGGMGYAAVSGRDPADIAEAVERAVALAKEATPDPDFKRLPAPDPAPQVEGLFDDRVAGKVEYDGAAESEIGEYLFLLDEQNTLADEIIEFNTDPDTALAPDIAFIRGDRFAAAPPREAFWPGAPVILESEHYGGSKARGCWQDGRLYLQAVEEYHASFASIHWWPQESDVIGQAGSHGGSTRQPLAAGVALPERPHRPTEVVGV